MIDRFTRKATGLFLTWRHNWAGSGRCTTDIILTKNLMMRKYNLKVGVFDCTTAVQDGRFWCRMQIVWRQGTPCISIEIHGIPECAYTETEDVVLKLAEALDVSVEPKDIEICHKLNRKGNKPIIVKFISHKVKTNLYRARAKLKNVRVSNIFPQCSSSTLVQADRIFFKRESYLVQEKNNESGKRDAEKWWIVECLVNGWINICQDLSAG